jgi:hypothetical protein
MLLWSFIPCRPATGRAGSPVLFVRRRVRLQLRAPQQMRGGGAPSGAPALCSRLDRSAGAQTNPGVLRALSQARSPLGAPPRRLFGSRPRFSGRSSPPSASSSQPGPSARRAVPRSRPSAQSHVSPAPAGAASSRSRYFSGNNRRRFEPVSPRLNLRLAPPQNVSGDAPHERGPGIISQAGEAGITFILSCFPARY